MSDPGERTYMQTLFQTIAQPLLVLDGDLRVRNANPAFLEQFQVSAEETTGTPIYELGNGQWDIPDLRRLLDEVLKENEKVEGYRVEHEFEQIGRRTMLLNASRIRGEEAADQILLAISDVTEREHLVWELEAKNEFAEKLIDSVREGLLVLSADFRVQSANQSFYDTFHVRREETEGRPVYELGNGQWDIPRLRALLEEILPHRTEMDDFEVEHEFENLGRRIMLLNARRLDHQDLVLLAIRDVTERREHERRQQAFMGELQHRVKNILNNVSVLASHTARRSGSVDTFLDAFQSRLGALARAQDLLMQHPDEEVAVRDLVRIELEAIGAENGRDFTAEGPLVCLPPRDAQTMSMVIHELTTNAAKYGALKSEEGRISVQWHTESRNDREHLCFLWREHGVRIEDTEPAKGFGSQVIEETLPHMLGGEVSLVFHPDGAECRIEFPLPE